MESPLANIVFTLDQQAPEVLPPMYYEIGGYFWPSGFTSSLQKQWVQDVFIFATSHRNAEELAEIEGKEMGGLLIPAYVCPTCEPWTPAKSAAYIEDKQEREQAAFFSNQGDFLAEKQALASEWF